VKTTFIELKDFYPELQVGLFCQHHTLIDLHVEGGEIKREAVTYSNQTHRVILSRLQFHTTASEAVITAVAESAIKVTMGTAAAANPRHVGLLRFQLQEVFDCVRRGEMAMATLSFTPEQSSGGMLVYHEIDPKTKQAVFQQMWVMGRSVASYYDMLSSKATGG